MTLFSDDQHIEGLTFAEKVRNETGRKGMKVVGWYHSHPRITVWPSAVDLRTQMNYQRLDGDFVGLIFSVYDTSVDTKVCPSISLHFFFV